MQWRARQDSGAGMPYVSGYRSRELPRIVPRDGEPAAEPAVGLRNDLDLDAERLVDGSRAGIACHERPMRTLRALIGTSADRDTSSSAALSR